MTYNSVALLYKLSRGADKITKMSQWKASVLSDVWKQKFQLYIDWRCDGRQFYAAGPA